MLYARRMLTQTAEKFFGERKGIAKALSSTKQRSVSAVYQWDDVVPLAAARRLAELSGGELQVVEELYDEFGHIRREKQAS
jgi:hypothetical protein